MGVLLPFRLRYRWLLKGGITVCQNGASLTRADGECTHLTLLPTVRFTAHVERKATGEKEIKGKVSAIRLLSGRRRFEYF